jgi:hypothetical protein
MRYFLLIGVVFLFVSSPVFADIYKYTDENGVECYTDLPLNKKANKIHKDNNSVASSIPETPKSEIQKPEIQKYIQKTVKRDTRRDIDYHEIVHEKASTYDLDPSLIKAVIKTESNWNDRAVSPKGAIGLMQLMPSTANDMNVHNPFDPEENIEGGTKYLKYLLDRFDGDLTLALAAYNAGPKRVEQYGYVPPITETRQYVNRVLSQYNGKMVYPTGGIESLKTGKRSEPIYKITMEDGSVLFTNSSLFSKSPVRF